MNLPQFVVVPVGPVPVAGNINTSWDASYYSDTGEHKLNAGSSVSFGTGIGGGVSWTFVGTTQVGQLQGASEMVRDLIDFLSEE